MMGLLMLVLAGVIVLRVLGDVWVAKVQTERRQSGGGEGGVGEEGGGNGSVSSRGSLVTFWWVENLALHTRGDEKN